MWCSNPIFPSALAGALAAAGLLAGCAPRALESMKEAHQQGRFVEVAATEVSCEADDERCNQMHLLKGDACYALGRGAEQPGADSTAEVRFRCAAHHLGAGIRQTETGGTAAWTIADDDRTRWYTNRAESLRQLQDLLVGESARAVSTRLLDFAQTYREVTPDAAAPHFYVATARYALLQPRLLDAPPGDPTACKELSALLTGLEKAPPVSDSASGPVQDSLRRLHRQIDRQHSRLDCSP